MPFLACLPQPARLADLFSVFPTHVGPLLSYVDSLMRGPGAIEVRDREMLAAYVSGLNACQFCYGSHRVFAEAFGVEEGVLARLVADLDSVVLDPKLKALLAYGGKLNRLPSQMVQADIDAVLAAGWSEQAVSEAAQICGLFNMMNRIIEGTGIDFDYETAPDARERLGLDADPAAHRYV
ncbi:MAG: carboxymuconolactone decarboxylase family protein [Pseudomonadota bacterium]